MTVCMSVSIDGHIPIEGSNMIFHSTFPRDLANVNELQNHI